MKYSTIPGKFKKPQVPNILFLLNSPPFCQVLVGKFFPELIILRIYVKKQVDIEKKCHFIYLNYQ